MRSVRESGRAQQKLLLSIVPIGISFVGPLRISRFWPCIHRGSALLYPDKVMKTAGASFLTLLVWSDPVLQGHLCTPVRSRSRIGRFKHSLDQLRACRLVHFRVDTGPETRLFRSSSDPRKRTLSLRVLLGASLALLSCIRRVGKSGETYYVRYFDNRHFNFDPAA
jgi:hypothetical protein